MVDEIKNALRLQTFLEAIEDGNDIKIAVGSQFVHILRIKLLLLAGSRFNQNSKTEELEPFL
jgi:hypothetical protein